MNLKPPEMRVPADVADNNWYVRLAGIEHGVYTSAGVRRLLLDGDAGLQDQISTDCEHWREIREVAEVIPLRMRADLGDRSAQVLLHARRHTSQEAGEGLATGFPLSSMISVMMLISGLLGLGIWVGVPKEIDEPQCQAEAGPGVNWRYCILPGKDVGAASLVGANLNSAILRTANFMATNLHRADLSYADLRGADLSYARLSEAVMVGANLQKADLSEADLSHTDLRFADLSGARLDGVKLEGTMLGDAIWVDGTTCRVESVGSCVH